MQLICFSQSRYLKDESKQLISLFNAGLKTLHIQKKDKSKRRLKALLSKLPKEYHSRIVIHHAYGLVFKFKLKGIHLTRKEKAKRFSKLKIFFIKLLNPKLTISLSAHSLDKLSTTQYGLVKLNYLFLSPVFDSISKRGHLAAFAFKDIKVHLKNKKLPVIALGGVSSEVVSQASLVGFSGVAIAGFLWKQKEVFLNNFKRIKHACAEL